MADYGLTKYGVNIKRLDTILEEMHTDLTEKWGVNTQQNPASLLNVLLTNIADQLAELWELGLDVYNSQYPTTAEGMYLDNVAQFAGVTRETAAPSDYHILCTGEANTVIPKTTIIASDTSPAINLYPTKENTIAKTCFNTATIKVSALDGELLKVTLNGTTYSVTVDSGTDSADALQALADAINDDDFVATIGEEDGLLHIVAVSETSTNTLGLSDNLTLASLGCVFTFATEDDGDIYLPTGTITKITKAVTGLESVVNVGSYIAGQDEETDVEFRQSYLAKIFSRSARMVDSIRSAILNNVQGVTAVAVYENATHEYDSEGRPPHSIEVVADGGSETEIAQQILDTKAAGINTFGNVSVTLTGEYSNDITICFSRPEYLNLWVRCEVTMQTGLTLTDDEKSTIQTVIAEKVSELECGDNVIPQNVFLPDIYSVVSGIAYIDITMAVQDEQPEEYTQRVIYASIKQRVKTDTSMIKVV